MARQKRDDNPLLDRAVRLMEFLGEAQRLRSRPVHDLADYDKVLWFDAMPSHAAVHSPFRVGAADPTEPVLTVDRVPPVAPPEPPSELRDWLVGGVDNPRTVPVLRVAETTDDDDEGDLPVEPPFEIQSAFNAWVQTWQRWADKEKELQPVRDLYLEVFDIWNKFETSPEGLEVICATGLLVWQTPGHPNVRRHLLTTDITIEFDSSSGRLTVSPAPPGDVLTLELDMVEPSQIAAAQRVPEVRSQLAEFEGHPFDRHDVALHVTRVVNLLDPDGWFEDSDAALSPTRSAQVSFAPALILRKRPDRLVDVYDQIVAQLRETQSVPDGLIPLVDPNHVADPLLSWSEGEGALVTVDDEPFLPLPVNEAQLRIIRSVDSSAHTLVQGPPGTGKTHTAAALIANLLARGKRVLVTAQTDRALKEVRAKLPPSIRQLSVSVVGAGRGDMSELQQAVELIGSRAAEYDAEESAERLVEHRARIEELRKLKAETTSKLVVARGSEVSTHSVGSYTGTSAELAQACAADAERFGWFEDLLNGDPPPESDDLTGSDVAEWTSLVADRTLRADEHDALCDLLDLTDVTIPDEFAELVAGEREATANADEYRRAAKHPAFKILKDLEDPELDRLASSVGALARHETSLKTRKEAWVPEAMTDARADKFVTWRARQREITTLIAQASELSDDIGTAVIVTTPSNRSSAEASVRTLLGYLAKGEKFKVGGDGRVNVKTFADKATKTAAGVINESVRINGAIPSTRDEFTVVQRWIAASTILDGLDRAWPATLDIPAEDTISERLHFHVGELEVLVRVAQFADGIGALAEVLHGYEVAGVDLQAPKALAALVDAIHLARLHGRTEEVAAPLDELQAFIAGAAAWDNAAPCLRDLAAAVTARDVQRYAAAYARAEHLNEQRDLLDRQAELAELVRSHVPALADAINPDTVDEWRARLAQFDEAVDSAQLANWLREREAVDVNALQRRIRDLDDEIRQVVGELAAERAWAHAVGPDRITGEARSDLQSYAIQVRKLGKGTGKHAPRRKAEIRQAMDRCRGSVPVWIMPIYRVVEQQKIEPNAFDVIIVDEASQAGVEATFLQHLAPKVVVIGDHKQVSPAAVGVDREPLVKLAAQYLSDSPHRALWQNPELSLFDHARTRYPGMITLTEHRRCVPEIIGFSNRIAYEPEGIRLIPVRQYGATRLDPVVPVWIEDGIEIGSDNRRVNPPEAEALVDQIEKCIADPRYDGLTFGVISLLGRAQAEHIQTLLLQRLSPEEWSARDLRCGDAADFQGSERDVVFLTMVATPHRRLGVQNRELFVQRYNVAVSRAKDQVWLYHSIRIEDAPNPEDMRNALLDYCYDVARRRIDDPDGGSLPTSETERDPRFDSLFEQRVYNRIVDRGCTVHPQFEQMSYRLDLVVEGSTRRLGVECDGDHWHGPEQFLADLARERDLERCGWEIVRVRESDFYTDPAAALAPLWDRIEAMAEPIALPVIESLLTPDTVEVEPVHSSSRWLEDVEDDAEVDAEADDAAEEPFSSNLWRRGSDAPAEPAVISATPVPETEIFLAPARVSQGPGPSEYVAFAGLTANALTASSQQIIDGLVAVVATEGPVVGERLHQAYCKASGGQRVGKAIASALNRGVTLAVRQGLLAEDRPLQEEGIKHVTFRLPEQPPIALRSLGPRTLDQVPPRELAAVVEAVAGARPPIADEPTVRAVLGFFRQKRLTENARELVRRVLPLVEPDT